LRRAARVDDNQREIASVFRKLGASVVITSAVGQGFPDLVIGIHGVTCLVEVKDGKKRKSATQLTTDQEIFHSEFCGMIAIVKTVDDAINLIAEMKKPKIKWGLSA